MKQPNQTNKGSTLERVREESTESSFDHDDEGDENTCNSEEEAWRVVAKRWSRAVARSRVVLGVVLILATIFVSSKVRGALSHHQIEDFEAAVEGHAMKIVESVHRSVEQKMQAIDTLSVAITSHALSTNESFPMVTLPDYEVRTSGLRVLSESVLINICMLVEDENRDEWEKYIQDKQAAYFSSTVNRDSELREYQDNRFGLDSPDRLPIPDTPFRRGISNLVLPAGTVHVAPKGSGPYLPIWQVSPAIPWPTSYNFNLYSHPSSGTSYSTAIDTGTVVMSLADDLEDASYGSTTAYYRLVYNHSQYRHQIGDNYKGGPATPFAYPIFDSFDPSTRKAVGVASSAIYWRLNFANVLPPHASGFLCVLSNSFNQTMTFRIDGSEAVYLGPGDLHDAKYDHLEVSSAVHEFIDSIASPEVRAFTSAELNSNYSRYYLKVYPSAETEAHYRDNEPTIVISVIIGVFLFTTLSFFTYDVLVRRQQTFVMNRAVASSAIVSSLFPAQVRESLYAEKTAQKKAENIGDFQSNAIALFIKQKEGSEDGVAKPIVSRFESTTIFFADIAGFTKWSAKRTPEQVFILLETLYQAFDEIATRRRVFKVETVGKILLACWCHHSNFYGTGW